MRKVGEIGKIKAIIRKTKNDHEVKATKPGCLARNFAAKAAEINDPKLNDIIANGNIRAVSNSRVLIMGKSTISAPKRIDV